jgi:hypothetical protein
MADPATLQSFSNAQLDEVLVTFNLVYSRCVRRDLGEPRPARASVAYCVLLCHL